MSALGAFTFVLHGHLPYSPVPTRWPYGETITYALISKAYIPLLQTLYDLKDEGIDYKLAICLTPTLLEQLANPAVIEQLNLYLDEKIAAAERDTLYFSEESGPPVDSHLKYLAEWYVGWYSQVKTDLNELCDQDLVGAFRRLQDEGYIEIIATAATSAYLPLLGHESAIAAQIKTGLASYEQFFGRRPEAFWLPECGYRPGLEEHLVREGLKVFFAEPHMITNTPPIGVAAGDVHGPLNTVKQRYMIPRMLTEVPQGKTTIQPYKLRGAPDLVVIGRDDRATMQVWGAINGYPGDVDYREPGRRYGTNNLQYWRVTG